METSIFISFRSWYERISVFHHNRPNTLARWSSCCFRESSRRNGYHQKNGKPGNWWTWQAERRACDCWLWGNTGWWTVWGGESCCWRTMKSYNPSPRTDGTVTMTHNDNGSEHSSAENWELSGCELCRHCWHQRLAFWPYGSGHETAVVLLPGFAINW